MRVIAFILSLFTGVTAVISSMKYLGLGFLGTTLVSYLKTAIDTVQDINITQIVIEYLSENLGISTDTLEFLAPWVSEQLSEILAIDVNLLQSVNVFIDSLGIESSSLILAGVIVLSAGIISFVGGSMSLDRNKVGAILLLFAGAMSMFAGYCSLYVDESFVVMMFGITSVCAFIGSNKKSKEMMSNIGEKAKDIGNKLGAEIQKMDDDLNEDLKKTDEYLNDAIKNMGNKIKKTK